MNAHITMTNLVKEYPNGVRGVDDLSLDIEKGEFFALLGPSGCGKTTLLRSIAGLEAITEGTLEISGVDMTNREPGQRGVAMVFQDYALFPHMDVTDNITYPQRVRKMSRKEREPIAASNALKLSLEGLLDRRPGQLSGGQQQRVALARAISIAPEVLLLDEPLSNLDARLRLEARTFLKELQSELGVTAVFVTHDQAEALALADRIAVMKDGKIQQLGTPQEIFHRPENTFVASFIGSHPMNLVSGRVNDGALHTFGTAIALQGHGGGYEGDITWGVRPEYVRVSTEPVSNALEAEVVAVEVLGATALITGRRGDDKVQAVVPETEIPVKGDTCWFTFDLERLLLFAPEGDRLNGRS